MNYCVMPILSTELSVSPRGELVLGRYALYGEMHDIESGEELFIPRGGIKICGLCDSESMKDYGVMTVESGWISLD
jgi:hypothetical protein